ncbi:MAG: glycosyltransferase family 39 protein [bacterium]|nr:glycosyltransferase family 39 protein [bacterium]
MILNKLVNRNWKVFLLFLLSWFILLGLTGTLTSGFHFTDDHDLLRIEQDLANTTISRETGIFIHNLFSSKMRFRPFFMLHQRIATAVLGADFTAWSFYFGLLAVFTSFFLFLFMRKINFSLLESILFAALTLLGSQAAIWWKLGANETIGIFLLSIAMVMMAQSVYAEKRKILYNILFILFTILATWSKESFILLIPALIAWQILLTRLEREKQEKESASLWKAVKENRITAAVLLTVCIATLLHILFKVGTTGIQYAGYDGFSLSRFLETAVQSIDAVYGWVILLQFAIIGFMVLRSSKQEDNKTPFTSLSTLLWPIILCGLIAVPQIALYMKSGIIERYLLPAVMGYAFLTVSCLRFIRMTISPFKGRTAEILVVLLLSVICLQQLRVARYTAIAFTKEGRETGQWFQSIAQNTRPDDQVLVITHPVKFLEPSVSLKTYMDLQLDRPNTIFTPPTSKVKETGPWKTLNSDFLSRHPGFQLNTPQAILIFPTLEAPFLNYPPSWFDPHRYRRYSNDGGFVSYYADARGVCAASDLLRPTSDSSRAASDSLRATSGLLRPASDSLRATSGLLRATSDSLRATSGLLRAASDSLRVTSVLLRPASDSLRVTSGLLRAASDSLRVTSVLLRPTSEYVRAGAHFTGHLTVIIE